MNFYPFHIGDYASATRHLTWDEDMAYRRLIDAYYTREAPIPLDLRQAYRLVMATTPEQREAVDVVLFEFFIETPEGWSHGRCDSEIAIYRDKSEKASKSAQARWNARRGAGALPTESDGNANASKGDANAHETACEGNATKTKTITNPKNSINPPNPPPPAGGSNACDASFERFWLAYPKKVGKESARKVWARIKRPAETIELVLSALGWQVESEQWRKNAGQFIPNPSTYLNQQRWLDEPVVKPGMPKLTAVGQKCAGAASNWLESEGFQLEKTA